MAPVMRALSSCDAGSVGRFLVPLDVETLKAKAEASTGGLKDYGELIDWDAFRTSMANIDERAHLIGRIQWSQLATQRLGIHLRITQMLRDHPEILEQKITKPIIIAGYVRSGSTWLQHLLVKTYGEALRYVPFWESLSGGIEVDPTRPFMKQLAQQFMDYMYLVPTLAAMHEVNDVNQPEEEVGWSALTMRSFLISLESEHPHLDLLAVEPASAKARYKVIKTLMQIKQWQEGPQQWFLKSPEHLNGIQELADAFPDAKVVTIHRDEVAVYKSFLILFQTTRSLTFPDLNVERTKLAADVHLCSQQRGLAATPGVNVDSFALDFHDVIKKPIDTLKSVSAFLGFEWNATHEAKAIAAVKEASSKKKSMGKLVYQVEEFGLTDIKIRERLGNCSKYFSGFDLASTARDVAWSSRGQEVCSAKANATALSRSCFSTEINKTALLQAVDTHQKTMAAPGIAISGNSVGLILP